MASGQAIEYLPQLKTPDSVRTGGFYFYHFNLRLPRYHKLLHLHFAIGGKSVEVHTIR